MLSKVFPIHDQLSTYKLSSDMTDMLKRLSKVNSVEYVSEVDDILDVEEDDNDETVVSFMRELINSSWRELHKMYMLQPEFDSTYLAARFVVGATYPVKTLRETAFNSQYDAFVAASSLSLPRLFAATLVILRPWITPELKVKSTQLIIWSRDSATTLEMMATGLFEEEKASMEKKVAMFKTFVKRTVRDCGPVFVKVCELDEEAKIMYQFPGLLKKQSNKV